MYLFVLHQKHFILPDNFVNSFKFISCQVLVGKRNFCLFTFPPWPSIHHQNHHEKFCLNAVKRKKIQFCGCMVVIGSNTKKQHKWKANWTFFACMVYNKFYFFLSSHVVLVCLCFFFLLFSYLYYKHFVSCSAGKRKAKHTENFFL